jgi:hypothetical protein
MALLIFCTQPRKGTYFRNALATRALTDMKDQKMLVGEGILLLEMPYPGWRKSPTCGYRTLPIH